MRLTPMASVRSINRAPSPVLARTVPPLAVILGSIIQTLPLIASAPVMPPLGFLFLLAWRQLRPGLLPVWAGLPLGFIDDLFSGQPMGSAMLLWSLAMILLDVLEQRFPWRSYLMDWLVAAAIILAYLLLASTIAHIGETGPIVVVMAPQLFLSVLVFPLAERFIALCDRARLWRFRAIG